MSIKPKELENLLENKFGFNPSKGHSSDHRWYELKIPGLPKILTKVSHSRKPINTKLEGKIARQLRVRRTYYNGMISCQHSKNDYYQQVSTDPYPPFDVTF